MTEFSLAQVEAARRTIDGTAITTPLIPSLFLSGLAGADFLLKLEMTQPIDASAGCPWLVSFAMSCSS